MIASIQFSFAIKDEFFFPYHKFSYVYYVLICIDPAKRFFFTILLAGKIANGKPVTCYNTICRIMYIL